MNYSNLLNLKYRLLWQCRELMFEQQFNYDYFMYIEADICIPKQAIEHWLQYLPWMVQIKYNVGFVRIEKDYQDNNTEFIVDLPNIKFNKLLIFIWNYF